MEAQPIITDLPAPHDAHIPQPSSASDQGDAAAAVALRQDLKPMAEPLAEEHSTDSTDLLFVCESCGGPLAPTDMGDFCSRCKLDGGGVSVYTCAPSVHCFNHVA